MNEIIKSPHAFNLIYSHKSTTGKILIDLQKRGFLYLFRVDDACIYFEGWNIGFEEFDILEVHSIETTPLDRNCILYAIECDRLNIKGVVINQPGNYANVFSSICIAKIVNTERIKLEYYGKEIFNADRSPEMREELLMLNSGITSSSQS